MARASTPTLLSLSRYASIMGLNPVHFSGGLGQNYWTDNGSCSDIWPQYSWQGPTVVSREDLAQTIHDAEEDIQRILGFPLAPTYFYEEVQPWPKFYDPVANSPSGHTGARGKSVRTRYGKVIAAGRRGLTIIQYNSPVVMSDADGDGFDETATVRVTTALTNPKEIKLYFATKEGDPIWEIRPLKRVKIASGVATITFDSWLVFDPTLWEMAPTRDGLCPIDVENSTSYEPVVDVYREFVDVSLPASQFMYPSACNACGGSGCAECALTLVDGCASVRNSALGLVVPTAATYSDGSWSADANCYGEPDMVKLWYLAGDIDSRYLQGLSFDPLSDYWAQTISFLATARLELPVCACGPILDLFADYRHDVAAVDRSRSVFFSVLSPEMLTNPFGTKRGEIRAWDRVARIAGELNMSGGAL